MSKCRLLIALQDGVKILVSPKIARRILCKKTPGQTKPLVYNSDHAQNIPSLTLVPFSRDLQ